MSNRKKPSSEDIELFRRSVGPVRRLQHDRVDHPHRPATPRRRHAAGDAPSPYPDRFSDYFETEDVGSHDTLSFSRPGLQHRVLQKLRRGQLPIGAELDLHGMTAVAARAALIEFVGWACDADIRCVRIIHGKGVMHSADLPVLKNRLNNWLRQHHDVLAFNSARRQDGGAGAVYVLLRAQRGQ